MASQIQASYFQGLGWWFWVVPRGQWPKFSLRARYLGLPQSLILFPFLLLSHSCRKCRGRRPGWRGGHPGPSLRLRIIKMQREGTSLVVQGLRVCLPKQETRIWSLVLGDSPCHLQGPWAHVPNHWVCTREPVLRSKRSRCTERPRHRKWRKRTRSGDDPVRPEVNKKDAKRTLYLQTSQ